MTDQSADLVGYSASNFASSAQYDTDDASTGEFYPLLVSESTLCTVQSLRRREHRASLLDRHVQAHRTVALYPLPPGVLRAGGHLDGAEQAAGSDRGTAFGIFSIRWGATRLCPRRLRG